jgi:competence protein ComEA
VAVLIAVGLAATAAWWIYHGGLSGGLLELEQAAPLPAHYQVDLNTADWPELAQIPHLGEVLSRRIVTYRVEHGPFASIDELDKIPGIGAKTLQTLRPYLTLSGTTAARSP